MEVKTDEVNATATETHGRSEPEEASNAVVLADGAVTTEERKKIQSETPPEDDCCPICFGSFTVPCRGDCGHWYCGNCSIFNSFLNKIFGVQFRLLVLLC